MAKAPTDPPSPVDAYEPPPTPTDAGSAPPAPPYAPAGYSQQPYGQQPYGQQPYVVAARPTNVLAIIAIIASGVGIFFAFAGPLAGVVMGHIALSQIKKTGEGGHGLALAAVIVGYALLALDLLVVIAYIVFFVFIIGTAVATTNNLNPNDFG